VVYFTAKTPLPMRRNCKFLPSCVSVAALLFLSTPVLAAVKRADNDHFSAMRWRSIGPTRAGRTRALDGVPSQPNVFYIGFDNGGLWRTTDYGSNWEPLFDQQPTSSVGAVAVAPSDPNTIYVGSGGGLIRPDLSTGDGVYKSIDAGKTWAHLGLRDSQMIADIAVDPQDKNRLFVAVLGHPYGPNETRGVFRSRDGGQTFEKVLFHDEYTSATDVLIDPSDPRIVYASLWTQQQGFRESQAFGRAGAGIYKSTDGGTTWKAMKQGLPTVIAANLALAPSRPQRLYAMVAGTPRHGHRPSDLRGIVGLFKSEDRGETWTPVNVPEGPLDAPTPHVDPRPLARMGGADLPSITIDPQNPDVIYSPTVSMWRSEDGGVHWTALRGAYGGDDYQRIWINPNNPNIIASTSDQGAVISGNRGQSWSNWYNQPTAAVYHVTADRSFPYRLCGGQQDSGSACVASRADDGMITFHDWHPVNIQEYGIAAPDPRDPDKVYGSARTDVTLYDRKTGQTAKIGPDLGPSDGPFHRNVRTMPLLWSPVDDDLLFYASNVVWKTRDRGYSWTRISEDLTRQQWSVPKNAARYAEEVKVQPLGAITALSASPRSAEVLWAGTDDGLIHVTFNGGKSWRNVTPPSIKPWTRIFNLESGHFSDKTAYAAANTMRIDDMNPHFWRTHDGGKTWQEINRGIAKGAVANSIREDPRVKGLLYAATETQVWVSFDDGEHWQSLRQNMPAVSVRDIKVKDDESCKCADLVAGTHGRGFWILDNLTPLRQIAAARAAKQAYLFAPALAVRVRAATNDPTEWPPEVPHGENPPAGALLDYYLAKSIKGPLTLEIVDENGVVIRSMASDDPVLSPDPALDRQGYDRICQAQPSAPNCRVPLYWPAPQNVISTKQGMHRVAWDLRYEPLDGEPLIDSRAGVGVPGHTYPTPKAPWAPPGHYLVRLRAEGQIYTQPLVLEIDPRVKISPADLTRITTLTRGAYEDARAAQSAYEQARSMVEKLDRLADARARETSERLLALAPQAVLDSRSADRPDSSATTTNLLTTRDRLLRASLSLSQAEVAPSARQIAECEAAQREYQETMESWQSIREFARSRHAQLR
jgi:photosystem II stability/assembly factor-like uncharacterized protein